MYMICPLDLSVQQQHIYTLLYKRSDFKDMTVKYTAEQLYADSNPIFNITQKMARTILAQLQAKGYLRIVQTGKKGHPTVYAICKEQITGHELGMNRAGIGHELGRNDQPIPTFAEVQGHELGMNRACIGQESVSPISNKDNEKDKKTKHMSVFDAWQSEKIHIHKGISKAIEQQLNKLTAHQAEEVITAIKNYSKAFKDSNYYYNNVWTLDTFIKQSNGYKQWLDEGKMWVDYNSRIEVKKTTYKRETIS